MMQDEAQTGVEKRSEPDRDAAPSQAPKMVRAWDLPTRLFHWLLAGLIVTAVISRKFGGLDLFWHKVNGYGVLTLLVYRVLWGFVGGTTARFSTFASWPWQALRYGRDLLGGRARAYLGHNPLGGWMVFALLAALAFQTGTGLFANDDALAEGPLAGKVSYDMSGYLTGLHYTGFRIIVVLVAIHVAVNLIYRFWKKEDLITPMISGYKARAVYADQSEARFGSLWLAFLCLIIAAVLVIGGIKLVGGRLF